MAPSAKTWLWIIAGVVGLCLVALFAVAGAGIYFVSQHIETRRATRDEAMTSFEKIRLSPMFKDHPPLLEIDSFERAHATRPIASLPTSPTRPQNLWILAWDPDDAKQVRLELPLWLLRLGRQKIDLGSHGSDFDFERLHLDVQELERIGPALILDHRARSGERVLIWTQ